MWGVPDWTKYTHRVLELKYPRPLCQCCVPDWTKYTHRVLELKYPRPLCQCCLPQTRLLEGLVGQNERTMYLQSDQI
ncbi:hypothetical protein AOLI_G00329650 [Acnodon oligacanthus]